MDPQTAFAIAVLMMLLNGGVLGLVHRDLPAELRPSAVSWRIGTLLQAGGCVLLGVQQQLPPGFVLPLGNAMVMLGMTGYWHALRQFYGRPDSALLLLPVLLATLAIWWFAACQPDLVARVVVAALAWAVIVSGAALTLRAREHGDAAVSRRVLAGIFVLVLLFMVLRAAWFIAYPNQASSIVDRGSWMNMITPMIAAILPVIGTTAFLLLCSERIRRQAERAAATDYLTGLANRRTIAAAGTARLQAARRQGGGLAVALLDIDHFKAVNDQHGHDSGDLALQHVAACIRSAAGVDDLAGRQGGEEFVVLSDPADPAAALAFAERLRQAVQDQPCVAATLRLALTVSIGVAVLDPADRSFDDLLRRADQALYAAKAAGRNRVVLAPVGE